MNNLCRLPHARSAIAGVGATSTDDAAILRFIGSASREIESRCGGRRFHSEVATRYFDGSGKGSLWLPSDSDLLSVTTLKVDEDGDGVFETTLTANTDYWLYPDNSTPKFRIDLNPLGQLSAFPYGRRRVQLVGKFGHSEQSDVSGLTGTLSDATDTSLVANATAETTIYAGDTLIMGDEQMYVTAVSTTTITVVRGVNGTTAVAQSGVAISIRRYPDDIEAACAIRTADLFRGAQTGYSAAVGGAEFGGFASATSYAQFLGLLSSYRLMVVA